MQKAMVQGERRLRIRREAELDSLRAEVERLTAALSDERAHAEEGEVNRASRRLIAGFMLDCNVIGHVAAAENLVRAIKGVTAHRARRQG
ncbi:hypothetical protein Pden_3607 [Paracoccus denitrificans PD1222]|uniref:Uncharacterized protein n=1 Tax=Paracoccus denitrificans (strain Pd 1222) TaxID=318586 RepID=A1B830_PARDP|nr:hypothetical protein Pden_3607 [Paracoccus denitrificans PD1222]